MAAWLSWVNLVGCATPHVASPPPAVAPASPPKDDGQPSDANAGGLEHAGALEQLAVAPLGGVVDRQHSVHLFIPDAPHWLRVRLWTVKTLAAFRYGRNHHALVAGAVLHVPDENAPEACTKAVDDRAQPWIEALSIVLAHDPPRAFPWNGRITDVDSFVATIATLGDHEQYAAAYATFPAWKGACLVIGIAVPARGEIERAKRARDRFVRDVLPTVRLITTTEPAESY